MCCVIYNELHNISFGKQIFFYYSSEWLIDRTNKQIYSYNRARTHANINVHLWKWNEHVNCAAACGEVQYRSVETQRNSVYYYCWNSTVSKQQMKSTFAVRLFICFWWHKINESHMWPSDIFLLSLDLSLDSWSESYSIYPLYSVCCVWKWRECTKWSWNQSINISKSSHKIQQWNRLKWKQKVSTSNIMKRKFNKRHILSANKLFITQFWVATKLKCQSKLITRFHPIA